MVLVVGKTPDEIRVSREQYLGLLARLDVASHSPSPTESELAHDIIDMLRSWFHQGEYIVDRQVAGQLELPLEWAETRAGR